MAEWSFEDVLNGRGLAPAWRALPIGLVALLLALGAASVADAQGDRPRRIVREVNTGDTRVVRGSTHAYARREFDQGRVDADLVLDRVAIAFRPSPEQQRELETLLAEQRDPSSPRYHDWLSPDEYAARFGMSDADLEAVREWLRAQGLTVQGTARSRNELYFRGTAAQIESAFRTEIHRYRVGGEAFYANATEPSIPEALSDVVLSIRRLSDVRPRPRLRRPVVAPRFTSELTGRHFLAPDDFATIYGVQALYAAGYDGTGQRIAVVGQTALGPGNSAADIDAFRAAAGLPAANLEQVLVPGTGNSTVCSSDILEAHLDVEWSGAIARNATVVYVFTGVRSNRTCETTDSNVWDALEYAITNNLAPVISTSYGACEAANGAAFARTVRTWVQQANAQGQTVTAASGDLGAADCEAQGSQSATTGLAVDVPASIPEVTAVGGTEFYGDLLTPEDYWAPTNNGNNGSAISYIPEVAWNDSAQNIANGLGLAASGGGASSVFTKPSWQSGTGVPADGRRDVPDVSLAASANHDAVLICSQGSCVNGFRDAAGFLTVIGGTSVGAPSLAGVLALINQGTGSSGLGNINPRLYALALPAPGAIVDIVSGGNAVPCTRGTADCPASPPYQLGYSAGVGYDMVTGLGSIDAFALADSWAAKAATTTSVSASSAAVIPGSSVTFTATVAALSTGTGSPAGGRVQFEIDGSAVGDAVVVARSGGAYRASYTADMLAGGPHSVRAEYLGNLAHLGSTASAISVNVADFALATDPPNLTVSAGGEGSSLLTVSTADGFVGTVNIACSLPSAAKGVTCSANPSAVTIDAGTPTQVSTLSIRTTAAKAGAWLPTAPASAAGRGALGVVVASLALGLAALRRGSDASPRAGTVLARSVVLILLVSGGLSCGGGGGGGGGGSSKSSATPVGNYAVTVTGSSGGISRAVTVSLSVQ